MLNVGVKELKQAKWAEIVYKSFYSKADEDLSGSKYSGSFHSVRKKYGLKMKVFLKCRDIYSKNISMISLMVGIIKIEWILKHVKWKAPKS